MMEFKIVNQCTVVATNSIKEVRIVRSIDRSNYDRNLWMVYTPQGGLMDEFTSRGPFVNFESAKRNAEMNVGVEETE
jgi:hypothetical protein